MKANKISTGDDPDQNASEETHYSNARRANQRNQLAPRDALIAELRARGIDVHTYSDQHGLKGVTDPAVFLRCLEELRHG